MEAVGINAEVHWKAVGINARVHGKQWYQRRVHGDSTLDSHLDNMMGKLISPFVLFLIPKSFGCECYNPLVGSAQTLLGDPELTCDFNSWCFVACDGDCSDKDHSLDSSQGNVNLHLLVTPSPTFTSTTPQPTNMPPTHNLSTSPPTNLQESPNTTLPGTATTTTPHPKEPPTTLPPQLSPSPLSECECLDPNGPHRHMFNIW
eukprot:TRINITY_DN37183_c0_g1_i1.p1 TRINITY_DN37183_c0_g1~~TRINITY_DN37183_c0_g1_i1.p1  ORF type:complete len:203 (-),score=52.76 TRINITY_DN37183_c0_g1_i1:163-771(-)